MAQKPLYLGIHVGLSNGETVSQMLTSLEQYDCNTAQIFLGSPLSLQGISQLSIEEIGLSKKCVDERNLRLCIHHPYVSNFCKKDCKNSLRRLVNEVTQLRSIITTPERGACVIHPGSSCAIVEEKDNNGLSEETKKKSKRRATPAEHRMALDRVITNLSSLDPTLLPFIAVENAAGERGKVCSTLEDLSYIAQKLPTIRFCIDTAHAFGAGLCTFGSRAETRAFMQRLDTSIGLERIACIHLNDSLVICGGCADRHARIGHGHIWQERMDGLCELLRVAGEKEIPLIGEKSMDIAGSDITLLHSLYAGETLL